MLQIIIIIIVIAVVWSILEAIFTGIADLIKEHPKGTVTFLFVALIGGLSGYGYYIGEFGVEELIFGIVGSFIFIQLVLWAITLLLKIIFAIRRAIIIAGIDNYFIGIKRTIDYSKLTGDLNSLYGGKRLKLDGSEYSDSYIDDKITAFVAENKEIVSNNVIEMVTKAGMVFLGNVLSTIGADYRNYCVGSISFETFVVSVLDSNFKSTKSMDSSDIIYRVEGVTSAANLRTSEVSPEDLGLDEDF